VGDGFKSRVIDALGRPLDGEGAIAADTYASLAGAATKPLSRTSPNQMLETGIRAVDLFLTLAVGQRVGIFAPGGVGKTSLITQLANQTACDHCILCLVGERGREVEALWSSGLQSEVKTRATIVAATSDQAAVMRIRAVDQALALADHWRSKGRNVVLIIDSVTRYAMALREVGLAAGEPPTTRGYTPSVFAAIPKVVERCGALKSGGSISAVMTVLSETEDNDDPICELMKSVLDGHVILSRRLAEQNHYPAIDVSRSISRLAGGLKDGAHRRATATALELLSAYETSRMLIETGAYASGSMPVIDRALQVRPGLLALLKQDQGEQIPLQSGLESLARLLQEEAA
jgi:flagellum-specific ATP synthase